MASLPNNVVVTIIGAGPAGLGCAALLVRMGLAKKDLLIVEKGQVGESFLQWPEHLRFITPSFPSNGYHQTDLNSITPDSSPAHTIGKERLSGKEYAAYLNSVVSHYQLHVREAHTVNRITHQSDSEASGFEVEINGEQVVESQYVIWAGGEFQTPNLMAFPGAELCLHSANIDDFAINDPSQATVIIGAYESGVDSALKITRSGHPVMLLEQNTEDEDTYDPSRTISPYTSERLLAMANKDLVTFKQGFEVCRIEENEGVYKIHAKDGRVITTRNQPINATGYQVSLGPAHKLFEYQDNGYPVVSKYDKSTIARNLFLAGPRLYHKPTLLCFIYKFRGRFALPCSIIGAELGLDLDVLDIYQQAGMVLDDLTCCETQQCFC